MQRVLLKRIAVTGSITPRPRESVIRAEYITVIGNVVEFLLPEYSVCFDEQRALDADSAADHIVMASQAEFVTSRTNVQKITNLNVKSNVEHSRSAIPALHAAMG